MTSKVELVWSEQVRLFELKESKPTSISRQPSPQGMEAIQEVDEDCFSTTKTQAKQLTPGGSNPLPAARPTNKPDITISDFAKAQEERDRTSEGVFRVITERTEEAETSRLDASQTSIKLSKDHLIFTFKKDRPETEGKESLANHSGHHSGGWASTIKSLHKSDVTVKEPVKAKKSMRLTPIDKGWSSSKITAGYNYGRERSMEKRLRSQDKDGVATSTRSRSNCDTERKGDSQIVREIATPWKPKPPSKRFFKSFKDILQRHGPPSSLFGARAQRTVDTGHTRTPTDGFEEGAGRGRLSPEVRSRGDDLRKSKSFLKLK